MIAMIDGDGRYLKRPSRFEVVAARFIRIPWLKLMVRSLIEMLE